MSLVKCFQLSTASYILRSGQTRLIYVNQPVKALIIYWSYCTIPLCNDHLIQTSSCYISGSYVQGAPNERYPTQLTASFRDYRVTSLEHPSHLLWAARLLPSGSPGYLPGSSLHSPENPWAVEVSAEYHNRSYSHPTYGPRLSSSATLPKHDYIVDLVNRQWAHPKFEYASCSSRSRSSFTWSTFHLTTNTRTELSGWNCDILLDGHPSMHCTIQMPISMYQCTLSQLSYRSYIRSCSRS